MKPIGRRQVEMSRSHAPVKARRDAESLAERARERLERTVLGVERDFGNRKRDAYQLPRCTLQQETPPHLSRALRNQGLKQPEKAAAAAIGLPRQIARLHCLIERIVHDPGKPFRLVSLLHHSSSLLN